MCSLEVRGEADGRPDDRRPDAARGAHSTRFSGPFCANSRRPRTVVAERRRSRDATAAAALSSSRRNGLYSASYDAAPVPFDEKRGGLGLALPIARRVIERHGGRVWSPAPTGQSTAGRAARSR